jgi:3-methyladenine DNA glycosylase AlkC
VAEPFKNLIDAAGVRDIARHLRRAWPGFDVVRFEAAALHGLETLELKARTLQIAAALQTTLPADFARAADIIEASLAPAHDSGDLGLQRSPAAPTAWPAGSVWPLGEFVARRGQARHPSARCSTLHALTQRFTAEFALRPFIVQHPDLTFATLQRWTQRPQRRTCAAWSAKAAARACPGGCS